MSKYRTPTGWAITVLWLAFMAWKMLFDPTVPSMKPNEWGDFFAGFFAPLAFLWLVLGYMQQGDELRLSTEALRLQAKELRNSVEQQRQLVEVSRLQVEAEREALRAEHLARQLAAEPLFEVQAVGSSSHGSLLQFNLELSNLGGSVRRVKGRFEGGTCTTPELFNFAAFPGGNSVQTALATFRGPFGDEPVTLRITYVNALDKAGEVAFRVVGDSSGHKLRLDFERLSEGEPTP